MEVNGRVPLPDLRGICPWPVNVNTTRYQTHDLTELLAKGNNTAGLIGGHVMARSATVLVLLMVDFGTKQPMFITAADGWLATQSYVTSSSAWATTVDWQQQQVGWSTNEFVPGEDWALAATQNVSIPPRALAMPLSTVLGEVKPSSVEALADGSFLYKFPKNFVGTIRVEALPGAASGSQLSLQLGEWLESPPAPQVAQRCSEVSEGDQAVLGGCSANSVIENVSFASFGTPTGSCGTGFEMNPKCNSANSLAVVSRLCLGKVNCTVSVSNDEFGGDPCTGTLKFLAAQVRCSRDPPGPPTPAPTFLPPPPTVPKISGGQQQFEIHVLRPGNNAVLETLFCWHGFQYVLVSSVGLTGFKGLLDSLVGLEIHTNISSTGTVLFDGDGVEGSLSEQGAAVLNGVNGMTLNSQVTNVAAYMPTDCPTREKHG
jgi:hypothetical protein